MFRFLKAQASSTIASAGDFLVTVLAVELLGIWYLAGSVIGTVSGGIIHFSLSRTWVFKASETQLIQQILKYIMAWNGSLLLNTSGIFLVTQYGNVSYIVAKLVVSLLVGLLFNYKVHKQYVFRRL